MCTMVWKWKKSKSQSGKLRDEGKVTRCPVLTRTVPFFESLSHFFFFKINQDAKSPFFAAMIYQHKMQPTIFPIMYSFGFVSVRRKI